MIRKTTIVLFTVVVVAVVLGFVGSEFGYRSPGFAFLANWLVMSAVAMLGGVGRVSALFPAGYFDIKEWEASGRLYRVLGIRLFKRLLERGPFAALNPTIRYEGNRRSLPQLASRMRDAEAAHGVVFGIVSLFGGAAVILGWWDSAVWMWVFNVVFNLYPILLQRYNRARLGRIMQ